MATARYALLLPCWLLLSFATSWFKTNIHKEGKAIEGSHSMCFQKDRFGYFTKH